MQNRLFRINLVEHCPEILPRSVVFLIYLRQSRSLSCGKSGLMRYSGKLGKKHMCLLRERSLRERSS
jgi:hypothetical protein